MRAIHSGLCHGSTNSLALPLQFYRVEVKVLPPEEAAAPRSRSVLRRFSHFQKLYSIVRPCLVSDWFACRTLQTITGIETAALWGIRHDEVTSESL